MLTSEAIEGKAKNEDGDEEEAEAEPEDLPSVSPLSKILVAFAGPLMNVVFAIVIAVFLWVVGIPQLVNDPVIGYVGKNTDEYTLGVRPGDVVQSINGKQVESWHDVIYAVLDSSGPTVEAELLRGKEKITVDLPADTWDGGIRRIHLDNHDRLEIHSIRQTGLLASAGFMTNDFVLKVNDAKPHSHYHLIDLLMEAPGEEKTITVKREGKETQLMFTTPDQADVTVGAVPKKEHGTWDLILSKLGKKLKPLQSSPATDAGMQPGDIIRELNGQPITSVAQLIDLIKNNGDEEMTLKTERTQKVLSRVVAEKNFLELKKGHGMSTGDPVRLTFAKPPKGLRKGAVYFARVEGDKIFLHQTAANANRGSKPIAFSSAGSQVRLFAQSAGNERKTLKITPHKGQLGILLSQDLSLIFKPDIVYSEQVAHPNPAEQIGDVLYKVGVTFKALGSGKESGVGAKDLSGPIGIFGMLAIQVKHDLRLALSFLVLLNINLAILNLLPVPVLDGGHILMSLIEWIRKKPVSVRLQEYATTAFAVVLISFFLYVTFADVKRVPLLHDIFQRETQTEPSE
jgi:membrane-associated protease RseP (regulator of RpoE activity)